MKSIPVSNDAHKSKTVREITNYGFGIVDIYVVLVLVRYIYIGGFLLSQPAPPLKPQHFNVYCLLQSITQRSHY